MGNICVVGDTEDLTSVYVGWTARRRGLQVLELKENLLGDSWTFSFDDHQPRAGLLKVGSKSFSFTELIGAYVRLDPEPALPPGVELNPLQQQTFVSERRYAIHQLLEHLPCGVANRPSAGRSNASKPYQMRLLAQSGFKVPEWIVSNDPAVVEKFCAVVEGRAIFKACSGLRSRVRRADKDLLRRLAQGTCPVIIQEYVAGRDVRVHTVTDRAFATEVSSSSVDYRFEDQPAQYTATRVRPDIAALCCRFARNEDMMIAGFDFRVTSDDEWFCLEANPVPTFMPYELATGQPVAGALLDALEQSAADSHEESSGD